MEHNEFCQAGIARMAIRVGDINRGVEIAKEIPSRSIKKDCGLLLEQIKVGGTVGVIHLRRVSAIQRSGSSVRDRVLL